MQVELEECGDKCNWLLRCHIYAVNCSKEYCPRYPLLISPDYVKHLVKRCEIARKGLLPPPLKIALKTRYPLPLEQWPQPVLLPSDIPSYPQPLPCAEPESLGNDQIKSDYLEVLAADKKRGDKKSRSQHVPMTWCGNIGSEGKFRWYRLLEERARWCPSASRWLNHHIACWYGV